MAGIGKLSTDTLDKRAGLVCAKSRPQGGNKTGISNNLFKPDFVGRDKIRRWHRLIVKQTLLKGIPFFIQFTAKPYPPVFFYPGCSNIQNM
jgi:hypothetical protein